MTIIVSAPLTYRYNVLLCEWSEMLVVLGMALDAFYFAFERGDWRLGSKT